MASGDGLLVRVRPPLGRLNRAQVLGLCAAAIAHGNGQIDLTRRAGLQLRGVREDGVAPLLDRLVALGLVDADPARDARPGLLVAPDWREGDDTHRIATALAARIDELPDLPPKIGFAIDAGPAPVLGDIAADFRIERGADGLLVRAEGRGTGTAARAGEEVDALIALARWFVATGGVAAGRAARHAGVLPDGGRRPLGAREPMRPGPHPLGRAYGVAFGRIAAHDLATACRAVDAVRITPWRTILLEGSAPADAPGLLADPADPLLHADACSGAPECAQANVATRDLATRLAPLVDGSLHVSGCAKGCARSAPAAVVLTGRDGLFDLGRDKGAGDPPTLVAMTADQILQLFEAD